MILLLKKQCHVCGVWSADMTLQCMKKKTVSLRQLIEIQDVLGIFEINHRSSKSYGIKSNYDTFHLIYVKMTEQILFQTLPN
jgi:hemerythrin superfamily protein